MVPRNRQAILKKKEVIRNRRGKSRKQKEAIKKQKGKIKKQKAEIRKQEATTRKHKLAIQHQEPANKKIMSLRDKFTGTGIAIVTPFDEKGKIDWDSLKGLIEFWIQGQAEYLVVLGTTGESATIHGEEKQQIFSFVNEITAGRLPLVAGIGGNDTQDVLQRL